MLTGMTGRAEADRCPGVLRPFVAEDGAVVRLRVPGGRVRVEVLADLVASGESFGAPVLQLTSRGNVQLRALPSPLPSTLVDRLKATGLLPSTSHELVRNVLAAPLCPDLRPVVAELDAAITGDPTLAGLPGRFLWAVSDPSGSVLGEPWDVAYQVLDDERGLVLVGDYALEVARRDAVAVLVERAHLFLDHRSDEGVWNVRDLPAGSGVFAGMRAHAVTAAPPLLPGPVGADLVAGVPLGMMRAPHVAALAGVGDEVTITPWRSVVVAGGARHAGMLADAGLVTTASSPWSRLSACVGAPSCRRTTIPTLDLATSAARSMGSSGPRIHVVGCERRCGQPAGAHVTVVAPTGVHELLAAAGAPGG